MIQIDPSISPGASNPLLFSSSTTVVSKLSGICLPLGLWLLHLCMINDTFHEGKAEAVQVHLGEHIFGDYVCAILLSLPVSELNFIYH